MPESMDALQAFSYLNNNLPLWLTKLDALSVEAAQQHARFTRMSQAEFTEIRLAKRKHDSTETLRPQKENLHDTHDASSPIIITETSVPPVDIPPTSHPPADHSTPIIREIRRKRKPGSAELSNLSGPQRYRTRPMIIVYYDSTIQEAFESMVRNVAGARNNLRKARTTASFKARMASMGMDENPSADDPVMLNPKLLVKKARLGGSTNSTLAFEDADKELEAAQNLCEAAAHQFLRDGDCSEEIGGTKQKFEHCLDISRKEAEKLRVEESTEKQEGPKQPESENHVKESMLGNRPVIAEKLEVPRLPTYGMNGTIEVDNDPDARSVEIDLSAIRRTRRM